MADDPRKHPRRTPVNVRGDLVGHEGAEELEVEDDRTTALATLVLAGILVVVAIATITQATRLSNGGNAVGPATAPWVIGSLLLVVGVLMAWHGRRDLADATAEHTPWHQTDVQDWKRLGVLIAALVVFAIINPFLGYVVSATLLFGITAIVLGAPDRVKAFAYGFVVAGTVYLLFDVLIGISLPAGIWGF
jgi:putative tricarboxylic transport membrane protein